MSGFLAVLLNGPPRSGKDTIGTMLVHKLPGAIAVKFAEPIRQYMRQSFGVDMDAPGKDEPHPALFGRTPREVAIAYSERMCKPMWGQDFFGKAAAAAVAKRSPRFAIFTDSGFTHEAEALADAIGSANILQIQVSRPGTDFRMDSRSHWSSPRIGKISFDNCYPDLAALHQAVDLFLVSEIRQWAAWR